jgi:hypothetical protein
MEYFISKNFHLLSLYSIASMDDKFLFQKITPTKVKVAVAYLTRTTVYIMDKSGNKWTCEFVLNNYVLLLLLSCAW